MCTLTFIFSYVLERKCEARVLSLDNAHFSKGALADDSQEAEVVEVHCGGIVSLSLTLERAVWCCIWRAIG
jgi:hypothetical protein